MVMQVFKLLVWALGSQLRGRTELRSKALEDNYNRNFCFRILLICLERNQAKMKDRSCILQVLEAEEKKGVERFIFLRSFFSSQAEIKEMDSGVLGLLGLAPNCCQEVEWGACIT